jgi:hypothetical protein
MFMDLLVALSRGARFGWVLEAAALSPGGFALQWGWARGDDVS